jgi:hypothetical protein
MRSTTGFCMMTLVAASFLYMPAASAQNQQNQSPSAPSITVPKSKIAPADIPDKKLDAAAAAAKSVSAVRDSYEQKLTQAPTTDKKRIAAEANNAITKAVTDQGLSVEEFSTIMEVAQNDPGVRDKLIQRMK